MFYSAGNEIDDAGKRWDSSWSSVSDKVRGWGPGDPGLRSQESQLGTGPFIHLMVGRAAHVGAHARRLIGLVRGDMGIPV